MRVRSFNSKLYNRWIQPKSWLNRLHKGAALIKGKCNYLSVQSLPQVDIRLPISAHRHFWYGMHPDNQLLNFLIQTIPTNGVFLDIGSNIGLYSTTVWQAMSGKVRIVAFEPINSTIKVLRETLDLNHVEAHIEPVALSSENGSLVLSAYEHGANNYWVKSSFSSHIPTISVPKMCLDDWCNQHPDLIPNAIKIDVEGHELDVLKGAKEIIKNYRPALVVECHCASWKDLDVSRIEFTDLINSLGYSQICDVSGQIIDFETQESTIHLLCSS